MQQFLDIPLWQILTLVGVAFLAGTIDAIVGGGGLLQLPLLLGVFPHLGTATPLGVNKAVSAMGNVSSAVFYWIHNPKTRINWKIMASSGSMAVIFTILGALLAAYIPISYFRPFVIAILLMVLWVVVTRRNSVEIEIDVKGSPRPHIHLGAVSGCIGLYDGLVGPATGTFLLLAHRRILGRSLTDSLGTAKIIQCCMNMGGAAVLLAKGIFLWPLIVMMGTANIAGSALGARLTLARGDSFVRVILVIAVLGTIGKLAYDQWG
jgi:uncharacterized membrane protein YfcA